MLGTKSLALITPRLWVFLFAPQSASLLNVLAQIGVVLFLFLVGLQLDIKSIRERGREAIVISHVSIIAPFLLGAGLCLLIHPLVFNDAPHAAGPGPAARVTASALFMGA